MELRDTRKEQGTDVVTECGKCFREHLGISNVIILRGPELEFPAGKEGLDGGAVGSPGPADGEF